MVQRVPVYTQPPKYTVPLIIITHQNGTFFIREKPTLTHHNPFKFIAYF